MSKRWRWNERTRMLVTLELALTLPALGLIGYSVWHLRSIQRDRVVEAAIQRDFSHVLKIAEKRMNSQAYKAVEELRAEFPRPGGPSVQKLEGILDRHPEVAHVMLYDRDSGFLARSQTRRMGDAYFRTAPSGYTYAAMTPGLSPFTLNMVNGSGTALAYGYAPGLDEVDSSWVNYS